MIAADHLTRLARDHGIEDHDRLYEAITWAMIVYDGTQNADAPDMLDQLDEALRPVINLLSRDVNHQRLAAVIGGDRLSASDRLNDLVDRLEALQKAARGAHVPPRGRGRPPVAKDLYALVEVLAAFWVSLGRSFTQDWQRRGQVPLTPATRFVYAVVELLDRSRLAELPEVTKAIVKDIRAKQRCAS